jgi:hypothetical protein
VSHRLEGIEDGVQRLDRALSPSAVETRLAAIEEQLVAITERLGEQASRPAARESAKAGGGRPARKSKAKKR